MEVDMPLGEAAEKRPAAATVVAVISLVFSSLALLGSFFRVLGLALVRFLRIFLESAPEDGSLGLGPVAAALDSLVSFSVFMTLMRVAAAGFGLAAGIGLLLRRRWSVPLATTYGAVSIGLSLIQYVFVAERIRQIGDTFGQLASGAAAGFVASIVALLGAVGFLLGSAFPLVVIVLVNQGNVRRYYLS
jgi:hypothetical protein